MPTSGESLSLMLLLRVPADERLTHGLISGCCQASELFSGYCVACHLRRLAIL
jgi:hypothetical protein